MQDEILEKEMKKKISVLLKNIEELAQLQIENINEILTYRNMIAYLLFLLEQQKSPQSGDFFGFLDL